MPRNTRQWARRKFLAAENLIYSSGDHLNEIANVYKEQHPEISAPIVDCLEALTAIITTIEAIRTAI